ncbi:MAG: hypothetical protein BMS9Abin28_1469 [Anaerolineae bacterium]|nr:MAG: hypothetical protein BMS9Abin28_1469 [Anaerolineae bacterium]
MAGGFEAWTLWGEVSVPMLSDLAFVPPYGDLTGVSHAYPQCTAGSQFIASL